MRVEFRIGEVDFHGISFEQFDDFPVFSERWAKKMVPGRALLASWDHTSQSWSRPVGPKKLKIAPGLQCLRLDGFGQRDRTAEAATLSRILTGLGVALPALKSAITEAVPPSQFTFDASRAVPEGAQRSQSWQVLGEARFDHFVLRFPVGRVDDWAILSVATDFVLSRRRIGQALPVVEQQVNGKASSTLAERVFDMMSGTRRPGSMGRPH
ncbi:hypothetical protein [Tropicimonas sp. S265A]|uniref:hypothetical protein n=1 Tax=Tropicimonas sp. S265A TaxID=3415134 RepID=UPI003C7B2266